MGSRHFASANLRPALLVGQGSVPSQPKLHHAVLTLTPAPP